ncbi:hypothetical protein Trydic_g2850 [Trypoxylus dichotomus]
MVNSFGHVLIGGGTGFIGRNLSRILRNRGYDVTVVSRMPGPKRITWHDVHRIGLPDNITAVVNLAGQNVLDMTRRWTEGFKQNVWNSRIQTTCALAKAIIDAKDKPAVFVTISGVGIYKPDNHTIYSESVSVSEFDFFSKLCLEWENAAKLPSDASTRQVTIRSGVVLGTDGGMIKQLYLPFFLGLGGPIVPGDQFLPWIHIDDLTRLFVFVIESANISGILNGVAPEEISNKEFSSCFAKALWRPAVIPVPKAVLNMMLGAERASMLTTGPRVQPKRTQSLGFKFLHPNIESACNELTHTPKVKEL